jgi:hypothetical protein
MDSKIALFSSITDILDDCSKILANAVPYDGPDFIESISAGEVGSIRRFDDKEGTLYVQAFNRIQVLLEKAFLLSKKLSIGSYDTGGFEPQAVNSLVDDIIDVNANGLKIHRAAYNTLQKLRPDSLQSDLVKLKYSQATDVYSNLQTFVHKALPVGSLPSVNRLKSITDKP